MFRRYVCVRQEDQSDCGAAALATIALHHRMPVGVQQLRDMAGTDCVGTNLWGLIRAAEELGFWSKGVRVEDACLSELPLPSIAHVHTAKGLGHFVVLHRVTRTAVTLADPACGMVRMSRDEFKRMASGHMVLLTPNCQTTPNPTNASQSPLWRLLSLVRGHKLILLEAAFCGLMMTLLGLSSSFFVQHLVDSVLLNHEFELLNALGVGMLVVLLFRLLFGLVRQYLLAHVSRRVDLQLVSQYIRHVLQLPMQFFETRRVGEILSRVNDAGKVREAVSGTTLGVVMDGTTVVLAGAALWIYDSNLAVVACLFAPLLIASVLIHHRPTQRLSREIMEQGADLSAHLVESVSAVETVKSFGIEDRHAQNAESKLVRVVQAVFRTQKLGMSVQTSNVFVTAMASIVILWYGGHRVMSGALTVGQLMFFNTLAGYILTPLERLAGVNLQIQEAVVALDRLHQILDLPDEVTSADGDVPFDGLHDAIELCDVAFGYGCRGNVLEGMNLRIPAGAKVAIVGESGSGKSTLLKLMMRFYDPTEGEILLDGIDMRDLRLASLRSNVGLVSQDPFIFNGTIRENIELSCPAATMTDVVRVARIAGLDTFIKSLPDRYETVIGERGANLSGGQRQRLAIARALLNRPKILLFDEATSHLDTATERVIQESLKTALADSTAILVAHRLSTIKGCDLICVMHGGQVVESGTHEQLIGQQGRYAALWNAQAGINAENDDSTARLTGCPVVIRQQQPNHLEAVT